MQTPAPLPSTSPCPQDQSAPIAPDRSALADLLLDVGIEREVVRGFLSARYRFTSTDCGLMAVAP
jgi:hypothetical protein